MGRKLSRVESKRYSLWLPVEIVNEVMGMLGDEGVSFNGLVRSLLVGWLEDRREGKARMEVLDKSKGAGGW